MRVHRILLLALIAVSAAPGIASAGQSVGPFTLVEMKVDGGHVGLMLNGTFVDDQCGQGSAWHAMLLASDPGFVNLYAAALSAMSSGKRVKFWIEGCSSATENYWGMRWPLIKSISVVPP